MEPAGEAVKRQLLKLSNGQFGLDWDELHPAQQAVVPRERFVNCSARQRFPRIRTMVIREAYSAPLNLVTVPEKVSTAVTVVVEEVAGETAQTGTDTVQEVNISGRWRWVLSDSAVAAYEQDICPA